MTRGGQEKKWNKREGRVWKGRDVERGKKKGEALI